MKKQLIQIFLLIWAVSLISGTKLRTPLERSNYMQFSSHHDLMIYLNKLNSEAAVMQMEMIGKSVQERGIPVLYFSTDNKFAAHRDEKPVVFIFCQQHGDEPSGKEAALILARELSESQKHLLKYLDVILMPQVNPDGSEKGERKNANRMDLNRNHVILSEPETQAVHQVFLKWMPEVTLDVHEYSAVSETWISHGFIKAADEQIGGVTNLNIHQEIINFSRETIIPEVGDKIGESGYSFHRYIVGTPFEGSRMRYSTTAVNDGRQSLGIYNTFSFILEGKQYADLITDIKRRTEGQLAAMLALLRTVADNGKEIKKIVRDARRDLLLPDNQISERSFIKMDYYPDSTRQTIHFPVFSLSNWKHEVKELDNFHPKVKVRQSVLKPAAYIILPEEERLVRILKRHRLQMSKFVKPVVLEVESYRILNITEMIEEEIPIPFLDLQIEQGEKVIPAESVIIFLNQPAHNLIPLILEPHSSFGLVTENSGRIYRFNEYLVPGSEYPIYRFMRRIELPVIEIED